MNFVKRALITIKRTPIKALILFLVFFLLGSVTIGAVVVREAVFTTETNLRSNMIPVVSIEQGRALMSQADHAYLITPEHLYEIANLPYVDYFDYILAEQVYSDSIKMWHPTSYDDDWHWWIVEGTSNPDFLAKRLERLTITSGTTFTEEQLRDGAPVAVVSTLWAQHNNLTIGDTFELSTKVIDAGFRGTREVLAYQTFEIEIIGLFEIVMPEHFYLPQHEWGFAEEDALWLLNRIHLPNTTVRNIIHAGQLLNAEVFEYEVDFNYWFALGPIIYTLHDPLYFETFSAAVEPILHGFYEPYAYSNRFETVAATMVNILEIADAILFSTIITAIIVVGLVTLLFLYDRRKEIGIYLALGEKKVTIIGQILVEIWFISIVALCISIFSGNLVANQMSQSMLRNELSHLSLDGRESWDRDSFERLGFGQPLSGDEMIELFEVSLDIQTTAIFVVVGFAIITISVALPAIYVMRLKPKKVLLEK